MCLPIMEVSMQIPVPAAAREISGMPFCGPFSVSTGQNYFRKLSLSVNIFLPFSLPYRCDCECCMSSLKLSEGTVHAAVHISSLFCVCSVWCYRAERSGGGEGQGKPRNSSKKEEAAYSASKKSNKSCAETINLAVVLLMFPTYPRVIQGLLKDEEKSVGYSFHNISWEQLVWYCASFTLLSCDSVLCLRAEV